MHKWRKGNLSISTIPLTAKYYFPFHNNQKSIFARSLFDENLGGANDVKKCPGEMLFWENPKSQIPN
ncbi:hypothetical protein IJ00_14240 [Calothrix sp. 336/3]|nr:hypothetical protein IJ00_14240 [Calothrix sp. 336/3]